jgi:hypothetical protein
MSSGVLHRAVLVRTDVSENILSPISGFLRAIGLHSHISLELLLISLPIKGYYVGLKNTVFWDVITAVSVVDIF